MMLAVLAVLTIQGPSPNDSGAAIFRNSCRMCHGANGRGDSTMIARLGVRPANLARCSESTAEPEGRWRQVVTRGGAAVGLSDRMPAFGASLTPRQIDAVVRYIRSLCGESGWPPGDLNFPRAFLVEKAFPENEWVLVAHGARQELIYEGRIGK